MCGELGDVCERNEGGANEASVLAHAAHTLVGGHEGSITTEIV